MAKSVIARMVEPVHLWMGHASVGKDGKAQIVPSELVRIGPMEKTVLEYATAN